ncbi:MAG: hypothetical protein LUD71_04615 [Clostridiales bacterium]|nr:hypothetical protein [Clostridiales bacterium]
MVPLTKLGQAIFARQEETGPPCGAAPVIEPDIIIGDESYDLAEWGIDGKIYYTPGHSRHDLSVVLREKDGTLAALVGDLYADLPEPEGVCFS